MVGHSHQYRQDFGFQPPMLCTLEFVGIHKQNLGRPHACTLWIKDWIS